MVSGYRAGRPARRARVLPKGPAPREYRGPWRRRGGAGQTRKVKPAVERLGGGGGGDSGESDGELDLEVDDARVLALVPQRHPPCRAALSAAAAAAAAAASRAAPRDPGR